LASETWSAIFGVVGGSALTGVATLVNAMSKKKKDKSDATNESVDRRMLEWEKITDRNERRMERLEQTVQEYEIKLELVEGYSVRLGNHIFLLEQIILRLDPNADIPPRPVLERKERGT